jgi:pimeloyl-ACP methyl ester carboxylesterase
VKQAPLLHYQEHGSGKPVVLLHGYMASSRYWDHVVERLAKRRRVIAIDLLGFGKSPKPTFNKYDYNAQLASINRTLEHLDITEQFTLVGHSMGALIALRYAREFPARISKLLLTNMPLFLDYREAKRSVLGSNFFYYIALRPGLHAVMWPIFKVVTHLRLLPNKVGEGAAARRSYMFQSTGVSRLRSLRNVIYSAKIEADLKALDMGAVLVSGLHDRAEYIRNAASLQVHKNLQSITVPGGHHLPLTQPDLITSFVL